MVEGGGRGFRFGREVETVTEATERMEEARPLRFRRYSAYKDSGIEWLGKIPAHWEVKRLTWLTKCLDGKRIPLNAEERGRMQGDYPYWGANSIVDYVDRWLFDEELVLLGEDGAPFFDKSRPVAFLVRGKIWVNNHAHVLRPQSTVDAEFLAHALNCIDYRAFIDGSTRDKLTQSDMGGIPIQCPVVNEQRTIATFLDRETARINGLVARKEWLIELLQEKRAALLTRAVTRGLDPNVPMKDSGVEWLGEIPVHWEVKKLGYVTNIGNGSTPNRNEARYWVDGSHPWLTSAKINEGVIATADQFVTDVAFRECHLPSVTAGSVLVAITGEGQTRGRAALLSIDSTISQHLAYITPSCREINAGFLVRLFEARYEWLREESSGSGSTRAALTCEFLRSARLAFPPRGEQRAIAAFLDRETARIDALIAKIRQAIDNLKEFRTALISAAVTGKIDVREEAS